jgi:hypothetical protein
VVHLERVRRDGLGGVQRDDLAVGRDAAQVAGEGGDAALARRIGRDEGGSNDARAPISALRRFFGVAAGTSCRPEMEKRPAFRRAASPGA